MPQTFESLLACQVCRAFGETQGKTCSECRGKAIGVWAHGRFLFWGRPIDQYHIALRRAARPFSIICNALITLVIIGALLSAGEVVVSSDASGWALSDLYGSLATAAFAGMLLITRVVRGKRVHTQVAAHRFAEATEAAQPAVRTWGDVAGLRADQLQDVTSAYTNEAIDVVERAFSIARAHKAPQITNDHLFRALLDNKRVQSLCMRLLLPPKQLMATLDELAPVGYVDVSPTIAPQTWGVLFDAYEEAWNSRQPEVDVTELLLTVVAAEQHLQEFLFDLGVKPDVLGNVVAWVRVREAVRRARDIRLMGSSGRRASDTNRAMTAIATPILNAFSQDLTRISLSGGFEPMIGRTQEIESVMRVLEGGGLSVLLVGNPGVGKSTIISGIADLMVAEQVPDVLADKRLVELDVPRLLAGADASAAEERLLAMLHEIQVSGNVALVIPSIEKMAGITMGGQQSLDVASVLIAELSRGGLLTIATTTPEAYRTVIANQSLGSVFQKIDIEEPDVNTVIQILEAKASYAEYKQRVWFSYEALERAALMAQRYVHDAYLPKKALDIMNEVAIYVRNKRGVDQVVRGEDVAAIIAEKTKIPVTAVTENEGEKLMRLEAEMHRRVVGQQEAVTLVANALRRARAELRSGKRPIANFLFLGPTGVGKTELTKTIAEVYFGSEQQMIRLDMSEYQDTNAIYRLIGMPGQQGTGVLTEAVRQQPFSLVLLDELEKADPNVLNLFLQVMDDGRLTDSVGRVIDFTNVIVIATSNAGTQFVADQLKAGETTEHIKNQLLHGELKQYFKPEFINRFDAVVLFQQLTEPQIEEIARIILKGLGKKLEERGIALEVTDAGLSKLAAAGYDPEFGARPLRRVIQDTVENQIAGLLLQDQIHRKDTVVVDEAGVHVRQAEVV